MKTKKITIVKEVWIPDLNRIDFDDFNSSVYSLVFVLVEKIYQTFKTMSYFQLSFRCLDIPMKQSLVFDIQLFRERLSCKRGKAYPTMSKVIMGNGGF